MVHLYKASEVFPELELPERLTEVQKQTLVEIVSQIVQETRPEDLSFTGLLDEVGSRIAQSEELCEVAREFGRTHPALYGIVYAHVEGAIDMCSITRYN